MSGTITVLDEEAILAQVDHTVRTGRGTEKFYMRVFGRELIARPGLALDAGAGDSPYGVTRNTVVRLDPNYRRESPDARTGCVAGLCERLPFRDGVFTTVLACFVLQHVGDIGQCLSELLRVSSADGVVAVYPLWRRRSWDMNHDSLVGDHAFRQRANGRHDALMIRRPSDRHIRDVALAISANGALVPPYVARHAAGCAMRAIVGVRGTTRVSIPLGGSWGRGA